MRGDRELQAQPAPLWQVRFLAMHVSPHAFPVLQTLQQFDPAPPHEVAPSAPVGTKSARTNQSVRKRLRISFHRARLRRRAVRFEDRHVPEDAVVLHPQRTLDERTDSKRVAAWTRGRLNGELEPRY